MVRGFRHAARGALLLLLIGGVTGTQPAAAAQQPACRRLPTAFENPTQELPGTLEPNVLSSFGVFARPQLTSDLLPAGISTGPALRFKMSGYYAGAIRRLAVLPGGRSYIAVPGFLKVLELPPPSCVAKKYRRRRAHQIAEARKQASELVYCVVLVGPGSLGGGQEPSCTPLREVARPEAVLDLLSDVESSAVLVPNGVAHVRIAYPHLPAQTLPVTENAYAFTLPAAVLGERFRAARPLRHIERPVEGAIRHKRRVLREASRIFARLEAETLPRVEWLAPDGTVLRVAGPEGNGTRAALLWLGAD